MAFSASVINRVIVESNRMFATPNATDAGTQEPAIAANFLLRNQRARVDEVLTNGQCVGVKAWYFRTIGIESVESPTTCTTPTGNPAATLSVNYDTGAIAHAAGYVTDARCDHDMDFFARESAAVIARLLAVVRRDSNEYIINALAASAQANVSDFLPDTWDDTTNTPRIDVPDEDFTWENLWAFHAVAANNFLGPDHLMLSGTNFFGDAELQKYLRLNDDGRAGAAAYGDLNMAFDIRQMDGVLGRRSTFSIDRNAYVFWNTTWSSAAPTFNWAAGNEKWTWTVADPMLMYWRNGSLVPVMYEVEMTKTCVDRIDATTQLQYRYDYYVRLVGGFETVPAGNAAETGILEFTNIG
jgi:hypothetical protein